MASRDGAIIICQALGRGVARDNRRSIQYLRMSAETGSADTCLGLARSMYLDLRCARKVGHVGEAAGVQTSAEVMEGHDVPPDVLTGCGTGDFISSTSSTGYARKLWRGLCIASTTGARSWAF
jgi:hypothetical protein